MSLTIVGGVAIDLIDRPSDLEGPLLGGSAIYASMAAAPFTQVRVVAAVGDDLALGGLAPLEAAGVDLSDIEVRRGSTATWRGSYGGVADRRRTAAATEGVAAGFHPLLSAASRAASAILLGAGSPTTQLAARAQARRGAVAGVDTIDHWIADDPGGVRASISRADVVFIGRSEARQLTSRSNVGQIAEALALGGEQALVLKGGRHGSWLLWNGRRRYVPAFPVRSVVDATGAGDAFAGAFMAFYSCASAGDRWEKLVQAMLRGAAAGSVAVEGHGIAPLMRLERSRIEERAGELASGSRGD